MTTLTASVQPLLAPSVSAWPESAVRLRLAFFQSWAIPGIEQFVNEAMSF